MRKLDALQFGHLGGGVCTLHHKKENIHLLCVTGDMLHVDGNKLAINGILW